MYIHIKVIHLLSGSTVSHTPLYQALDNEINVARSALLSLLNWPLRLDSIDSNRSSLSSIRSGTRRYVRKCHDRHAALAAVFLFFAKTKALCSFVRLYCYVDWYIFVLHYVLTPRLHPVI